MLGSLALLSFSLLATPARTQELARVPLVRMTRLSIGVEVVDGVASTRLRQTWRNDTAAPAEATWILPLPPGAVADGFTMTVGGVVLAGEVLDAGEARGIYESIVRRRRDPGLLEYFGRGCLRARIFPIPPRGEVGVDVTFRQVLPERLGLRRWAFALDAAGAEGLAPDEVVLDLVLRSKRPIRNVFSPLPALHVSQKDEHEARASFEGPVAALAGAELSLYYGLSEQEFGLDLLMHRRAGDPEGTFLMLIAPKREWQRTERLEKALTFVLDTSGSMEGAKIEQARAALRSFLEALEPADRFDVIPFSMEAEPFFGELVPADPINVAQALERVQRVTAGGGTNIADALERALAARVEPGRVPLVVFLTDGLPTVGLTDPQRILEGVRQRNAGRARLFVLGVGHDVDTHLLDSLALENGGARDYVRERERIDDKTRALFAKLAHPVMTGLELEVDGMELTRLVPARLPDLFAGDRIELLGRYAGEGPRLIRLSGLVGGVRREYAYEATFTRDGGQEQAFVPALWAERRVGALLDAIRLNGADPELVSEIERLGREHGIVTPYTSHLVLEQGLREIRLGSPPATGAGPSSPGTTGPGPAGAGPASPASGGGEDAWFLGGGGKRRQDTLDELAARLSAAGVLPQDAPADELARLARAIARELQEAEQRWNRIGADTNGAGAVEESVYLDRLMREGTGSAGRTLLEVFTRRVGERVFVLRDGTWVDQLLGTPFPAARRRIEAFSSEYFALLAARPDLSPYLAFSTCLVLRLGDEVLEIVPPPEGPGTDQG
jgi:Ca-activated chloride channel family protein